MADSSLVAIPTAVPFAHWQGSPGSARESDQAATPAAELEAALCAHASVSEAVAFVLPHDRRGEVLVCVVVLAEGARGQVSELEEFLRGRIALGKIPERIYFADEIPRNSSGKPLRQEIAARVCTLMANEAAAADAAGLPEKL